MDYFADIKEYSALIEAEDSDVTTMKEILGEMMTQKMNEVNELIQKLKNEIFQLKSQYATHIPCEKIPSVTYEEYEIYDSMTPTKLGADIQKFYEEQKIKVLCPENGTAQGIHMVHLIKGDVLVGLIQIYLDYFAKYESKIILKINVRYDRHGPLIIPIRLGLVYYKFDPKQNLRCSLENSESMQPVIVNWHGISECTPSIQTKMQKIYAPKFQY